MDREGQVLMITDSSCIKREEDKKLRTHAPVTIEDPLSLRWSLPSDFHHATDERVPKRNMVGPEELDEGPLQSVGYSGSPYPSDMESSSSVHSYEPSISIASQHIFLSPSSELKNEESKHATGSEFTIELASSPSLSSSSSQCTHLADKEGDDLTVEEILRRMRLLQQQHAALRLLHSPLDAVNGTLGVRSSPKRKRHYHHHHHQSKQSDVALVADSKCRLPSKKTKMNRNLPLSADSAVTVIGLGRRTEGRAEADELPIREQRKSDDDDLYHYRYLIDDDGDGDQEEESSLSDSDYDAASTRSTKQRKRSRSLLSTQDETREPIDGRPATPWRARRRKRAGHHLPRVMGGRTCMHCNATQTPEWRTGPNGKGTLCNACGLRWKKTGQ